ncbi:hypothetical protein CVT25_000857 [Psilocybe cyanescens]|uniref:F-box domain-containing protein n=1 Tax=Psilocybe cyanescens TaxID=93625 RepID=A0A409XXF4_PSICY|nr:hypothetical protein CVT25_000857 [Psilocybe cyanescens]
MSLSAKSQDAHMLSALPAEVVDDIIEEACRTFNISSVASIALTSHVFRIHANKERFSSLIPCYNDGNCIPHPAKGIRGLANIIRGGQVITTMPGVCSFATSFSLEMIGYYKTVMSALNDGSLAYIFRNLFRPPLYTHPASSICSLSLYLHRFSCRDDDDYDNPSYAATH